MPMNGVPSLTAQLHRALGGLVDTPSVLLRTVEELGARFGADVCAIRLRSLGSFPPASAVWVRPGLPQVSVSDPIPEPLMEQLFAEGAQLIVDDLARDPQGLAFVPAAEVVRHLPSPISLIAVPIPGANTAEGVFAAVIGGTSKPADSILSALEPIASEIARALSTARLYEREKQHLLFFSRLREAFQVLFAYADSSRVQQNTSDLCVNFLGASACLVWTVDPETKFLTAAAPSGFGAADSPLKALSTEDAAHPVVRAFNEKTIQPIDPATAAVVFGSGDFVAGFAVPLQAGGEAQGVVTPGLRQGAPVPLDGLVLPAGLLSDAAAQALRSLKTIEFLEEHSERDAVTGFYKRDAILKRLEIEIRRAERSSQPVSLANVRIEGVSEAIKKFGAVVGDALLPKAANLLARATRTVNVIGRDREDRFFVLVFDANKSQCQRAAETIQRNFSSSQDPKLSELGVKLNVTFGIASYPEDAFDVQSLALRAEEALDEAIRSGPGSVVLYGALSEADSGLEL